MSIIEKDYFLKYIDQSYLGMMDNINGVVAPEKAFCLQDNGINVESFSGWGLPARDLSMVKSAYVDGEFISSAKLGTRSLTMNISSDGCSRADYWKTRGQLVDYLYNLSGALANGVITYVPQWFQGSGVRRWEEIWDIEYMGDNFNIPRVYPDAANVFKYTNGSIGPLMWMKEINGRTYHTYVHYKSGADFSPRNLEEWREWGIEESLEFEAYDPYIYLTAPRICTFDQVLASPLTMHFEYWGNARAKPIVDFYDFTRFLVQEGDYVEYQILFHQMSENADPYSRDAHAEIVNVRITYEMMNDFYIAPAFGYSTRLMVNFSRRGTGVWVAAPRMSGSDTLWSMWPMESAIVPPNYISGTTPLNPVDSLRNFSLVGLGPIGRDSMPYDPPTNTDAEHWFTFDDVDIEEGSDRPATMMSVSMTVNSPTTETQQRTIKGSCVFYETYGGL